ncbi:prephenate dehydratase [Oxalobacter formigenes]|uniref:Bifunctional chorismate mutase/prephenate dehydratase n=1 Tax=Oxalobacter formigenes OXCC13 TaxID=556269 RepID=C3XD40_OXAFO|nr:prephenate dehydratase [Oxalobacter formigenes]ARQ46943.1 P-protein [Oxalobacter formigenes]ARQ78983.1 chorismate mutase [Oxalobacter formigenes OXCC13]EEO29049.1 chorismate mutase [Oxalobacter formigenes OXCC13]MCZ4063458.1 prephenate dehydratase [Oxalobacter formigenes]QDX32427.1 prephenate dehydratase [Oxalobacter formigenes]
MEKLLKPLRDQIDAIDVQLLDLLNRRARVAQEVGHVKNKVDAPVFRPEREAQVLRGIADRNPGPLGNNELQTIFREIMSACRSLEKKVIVAYLGPEGTFSEQAVYQHFGKSINAIPCASIDEVFRAAEAGTADFGVVPIENSTEGAISRTLDLLMQTPLTISSEVSIPIHHNLMTLSGNMDGVRSICAHSQALAQCQGWLNQHYPNIMRQAVASNAEAARLASEDPAVAAIAGEIASQHYGLQVVSAHIQDEPQNRTRFAVIGHKETEPSGKDQTSLVLSVQNKAGAVYKMLAPLEKFGVSMTRFESRPAKTGAWEYYFFVDIEGHVKEEKIRLALAELKDSVAYFKVLGSYPI